MSNDFHRPDFSYQAESLPNSNRFSVLTNALKEPVPAKILELEINYAIDSLRKLDKAISLIIPGNIAGADDPANANMVVTTDGLGNLPFKLISNENCQVGSISGDKLIPSSVTALQIGNGQVSTAKLAAESVTTPKIDDEAVTEDKLADGSVTTRVLHDESVTSDKIAAKAVGEDEIDDDSITTDMLQDDSVTTPKITDLNVTLAKLAQEVTDRLIPIGSIIEFSGSVAPAVNWVECNGQAISRATYSALFTAIGTTYGTGNGTTTFNIPDRRGRVAVGIGADSSTGGRITAATSASITLGGTFGAETHTLTVNELAAHTHTQTKLELTANVYVGGSLNYYPNPNKLLGTDPTGSTGGDQAHNNVQPSIFMRYYIRAL
jgi:microcystin-dependent protein